MKKDRNYLLIPKYIGAGIGAVLLLYGWMEYFSPFCWIGAAVLIYNVYKLIKIKKQAGTKEDEYYKEEDDEHTKEIRKNKGLIGILNLGSTIAFIVAGVLWIIAFSSEGGYPAAIAITIVGGLLKLFADSTAAKQKKYIGDNIVRLALDDVFEVTEYNHERGIEDKYLRGADFGMGSFDYATGNDRVIGKYKDLPIMMSDIRLISVSTTTDEDGREQTHEDTVFKGLWMICDFGKELSADLRIWERGRLGKLVGGNGIRTENEAFNKRFRIESEIEHEAFYILTPHMMEYILGMDDKAKGDTHIRFSREGKVHIAIGRGYDMFEIGKDDYDATALRRKFVNEIRYVTDLIDELRLVDTLYKK